MIGSAWYSWERINAPSLNAIDESLARDFNTHNKKFNEKYQFEFGEAVSNDAKTLSYHVEEENTILRNMLRMLEIHEDLQQPENALATIYR